MPPAAVPPTAAPAPASEMGAGAISSDGVALDLNPKLEQEAKTSLPLNLTTGSEPKEGEAEVTERKGKVEAANKTLDELKRELAALILKQSDKEKHLGATEELRNRIQELKLNIEVLKKETTDLEDKEKAAQEEALENSKQVEVVYAAVLILIVGTRSQL